MKVLEIAWYYVHGIAHSLTHSHTLMARGLEQLEICAARRPGGRATIFYRPHAHAKWAELDMAEFLAMITKDPKWKISADDYARWSKRAS